MPKLDDQLFRDLRQLQRLLGQVFSRRVGRALALALTHPGPPEDPFEPMVGIDGAWRLVSGVRARFTSLRRTGRVWIWAAATAEMHQCTWRAIRALLIRYPALAADEHVVIECSHSPGSVQGFRAYMTGQTHAWEQVLRTLRAEALVAVGTSRGAATALWVGPSIALRKLLETKVFGFSPPLFAPPPEEQYILVRRFAELEQTLVQALAMHDRLVDGSTSLPRWVARAAAEAIVLGTGVTQGIGTVLATSSMNLDDALALKALLRSGIGREILAIGLRDAREFNLLVGVRDGSMIHLVSCLEEALDCPWLEALLTFARDKEKDPWLDVRGRERALEQPRISECVVLLDGGHAPLLDSRVSAAAIGLIGEAAVTGNIRAALPATVLTPVPPEAELARQRAAAGLLARLIHFLTARHQ